ncbi:MAG: hypothetical protein ACREQJ_02275 [Candidatus Binatia bacterium]
MKRIPGIKPYFTRSRIVRPDGTVLEAWEMFVGERSYGRSNSKNALLRAWEARLEEAENARPFVFRPAHRLQSRPQPQDMAARGGAKRPAGEAVRIITPAPRPETPKVVDRRKRASR